LKEGFHLKFIPSGRLNDLQQLANDFPFVKEDKHVALCKYIETFSSIIERCWNSDSEFVGVSQRLLKGKLGLENKAVAKLLDDLVEHNFLELDKNSFKPGIKAWDYKPVYNDLETIVLYRNHIKKAKTDEMLFDVSITGLKGDAALYENVFCKIKLCNDVYDYVNTILNNYYTDTTECTTIYCDSFVHECDSFVPYKILGKIPTELIPVFKLLAGKYRVSRPSQNSRVYTNITNLKRDYRKFLRLNDKPLIGFDIKNSQPLLASVLFKHYDATAPDVTEYIKACEKGKFYEYFMAKEGIDLNCETTRTEFKKRFFGKVFFSMEVEKDNPVKTMFKEKYPTCYEAIFHAKGGFYSKDYPDFPIAMQILETQIIFDTNIELIKMGYDVVNIFDALYSDSEEAIEVGKKLVAEKFAKHGIKPTFSNIDYRNYDNPLNDLQCRFLCMLTQHYFLC
jgi:hypothetical protein